LPSEEKGTSCEFVHFIFSNIKSCPKLFPRAGLLTPAPLTSFPSRQYEVLPRGFVSSSTLRLTASVMMSEILASPIKETFILKELYEVVSKGKVSLEQPDLA